VIAPELPYPVEVVELSGGERFNLTNALTGSVISGHHRVPSLIYRVDLPRAPQFLVDRAEALGVPRERWSHLQAGGSVEMRDRTVHAAEVMGPPRTGVSFGFMTDTRPVPGAAEFLSGVDLLVSEGTYGDSAMRDKAIVNKHMTFAEAAEIARDAGAGKLWLTHFSPSIADPAEFATFATELFPETAIGFSGLTESLRFRD
jgi:ribonuclease Z